MIPIRRANSIKGVRIAFLTGVLMAASAFAQMGPTMVDVAPVRTGRIELSRPLVASVEATVRTTLAAEEAGLVSERLFDDGQKVAKGAILVRTNIDLLKVQLTAVEAVFKAMHSQIEQAKAERDRAKIELDRMRPVIEQKAAPQMMMDNAQRDMRVTEAVVANREAMLAEKAADYERLKLMIQKSEVRSPFDAVVAARHVEVGEWIKQGDPVAELVQMDPVFVRANVPEALVARIRTGDTVQITFDALPGKTTEGKIDQILPEADSASRTFGVKILVSNPDLLIRPGFFARATFFASTDEGVKLVPRDAVVNAGDKASVVAVREGKAVVVPVEVVAAAGEVASVRGELTDGEQVITKGNEGLRGGEQLMIRGAPPAGRPQGQ